jgi:TorA maturation chaperone TorD
MYEFLSALYLRPPTDEVVGRLLSKDFLDVFGAAFSPACGRDFEAFRAQWNGDRGALRQEYDDLFIVPLGRYVAPYEAVYRDRRTVGTQVVGGLLMGRSTVAVTRAYREAGATVSQRCPELTDHVGVELGFMRFLCEREQAAWDSGDTAEAWGALGRQRDFLNDHLVAWIPLLGESMRRNARSHFYKGVARLTTDFVLSDASTLESLFDGEDDVVGHP